MLNFKNDRQFIENKFHKTNEPFDAFQRMAYHGYEFDPSTGKTDDEIRAGLEALSLELKDLPHPIAKAHAVQYVLDNTMIDINKHDIFVGFWSVNRLSSTVTNYKWDRELFKKILPETDELMVDLNASKAVMIWPDYDHVIPDWEAILQLGFPGLKKRAADYRELHRKNGTLTPEMDAHFEGIDILYGAIIDIIRRFYSMAKKQTHDKAEQYAECLEHIAEGAPQNIYEAMQVIYIYFIISECFDSFQVRSLGNGLDNSLYSYYKNDLEKGTFTHQEITEMLSYFLMQWQAIGNYWGQPFYMGGTNADGSTKYNELSYDILDVYEETGIYNPKVQLKINENTPDRLLNKVFNMIRNGHSCFVFCCEPGFIKASMSYGATYEEARTMDICGCYETRIRANEASPTTGYVNALKPIEYVFTNGFDAGINKQLGLKTGEIDSFKRFEDFYSAVLAQWSRLIDMCFEVADAYEPYLSWVNPSIMYSATIGNSLKNGRDAYQDGVKYSNSTIFNCGIGSLIDAVMAVKELVYDKQEVTLAELKKALDANWEGYEALRTKALKSSHKYGTGDTETLKYAEALSLYFGKKVGNRPNKRGGVYKSSTHSAMAFVWQGECTYATPDGRKTGDEISKNSSPTPGMDKNGVTALINDALKMHPELYPESFCVDTMLHPTAVQGDDGLAAMKAMLMTYLKGGGMSLQMNVFNTDVLRDAQNHPERYKNLQVRVCGWNVLWNNLSRKEQDAYILRAENIQ